MYQADVAITSTYNPTLVTLSILIAVVASYTALNLTGRVTIAYGRVRLAWLIGGAITMESVSGRCTLSPCWLLVCRCR